MFAIRTARPGDLPAVKALLAVGGLPSEDVNEQLFDHFIVIGQSTRIVGSVGIEPYGDIALLRSLAVDPMMRGEGVGGRLLDEIEMYARTIGIHRLYLLTTSADRFFEHHHFQRVDRTSVPAVLQKTSQFTSLCPASATCLCKSLS